MAAGSPGAKGNTTTRRDSRETRLKTVRLVFHEARRELLVGSCVLHKAADLFAGLAKQLDEVSEVQATFVVDLIH